MKFDEQFVKYIFYIEIILNYPLIIPQCHFCHFCFFKIYKGTKGKIAKMEDIEVTIYVVQGRFAVDSTVRLHSPALHSLSASSGSPSHLFMLFSLPAFASFACVTVLVINVCLLLRPFPPSVCVGGVGANYRFGDTYAPRGRRWQTICSAAEATAEELEEEEEEATTTYNDTLRRIHRARSCDQLKALVQRQLS